jgi:Ras-related protein Rab-6A
MKENENEIDYKIAFLGDSMVGKTSIFRKLFTSTFREGTLSTVGVEVKSITFEDVEVNTNGKIEKKCFKIAIYDTAGQEKFRSIPKNYIRGSDGIILIYDITKKETFDHIETWLESLSNIKSDNNKDYFLVLLLGNKLDLANEEENNNDEDNINKVCREVTTEEGEKACKKYNFDWGGECSAKDFTSQQFKDLILNFAKKIYSNIPESENKRITVTKKNNLQKNKKKWC